MFWIQALVILACIMIGARKSGVAMGFAGGVGLFILVFIFGLRPASPPVNVLLIIIAVSSMAACLQVAGGLDLLVHLAEKLLRRNPNRITFMAPIVTFLFTVFTGTSYVALAVYPVICEVALEAKIRVERPMSIALIASQHGISASPVSASTAALLAVLAAQGVSLGQIMLVLVPAIFLGIMIGAVSVYKKGLELENDPEFKKLIESGEITLGKGASREYKPTKEALISVTLFALGVASIVLLGSVKSLMPHWMINGKDTYLSIPNAIEIIAFFTSFLIVFACGLKPSNIAKSSVFSA
ncbi:anaerobic C4-dicarboxylate transporter family protein, partial [Turicimonas muris]